MHISLVIINQISSQYLEFMVTIFIIKSILLVLFYLIFIMLIISIIRLFVRIFNIVTSAKEKCGGNPIDLGITNIFIDTIDNCNLNDIEYSGGPFTQANSQWDDNYI